MALLLSAVLFGLFALNVALGAAGRGSFFGDVAEMLVLFAASIAFVVAVIRREAAEGKRRPSAARQAHSRED